MNDMSKLNDNEKKAYAELDKMAIEANRRKILANKKPELFYESVLSILQAANQGVNILDNQSQTQSIKSHQWLVDNAEMIKDWLNTTSLSDRQKTALEDLSTPQMQAPYPMEDDLGFNTVNSVTLENGIYTLKGKNTDGDRRSVTYNANTNEWARLDGNPNIGVVGEQMRSHFDDILRHFNVTSPQEVAEKHIETEIEIQPEVEPTVNPQMDFTLANLPPDLPPFNPPQTNIGSDLPPTDMPPDLPPDLPPEDLPPDYFQAVSYPRFEDSYNKVFNNPDNEELLNELAKSLVDFSADNFKYYLDFVKNNATQLNMESLGQKVMEQLGDQKPEHLNILNDFRGIPLDLPPVQIPEANLASDAPTDLPPPDLPPIPPEQYIASIAAYKENILPENDDTLLKEIANNLSRLDPSSFEHFLPLALNNSNGLERFNFNNFVTHLRTAVDENKPEYKDALSIYINDAIPHDMPPDLPPTSDEKKVKKKNAFNELISTEKTFIQELDFLNDVQSAAERISLAKSKQEPIKEPSGFFTKLFKPISNVINPEKPKTPEFDYAAFAKDLEIIKEMRNAHNAVLSTLEPEITKENINDDNFTFDSEQFTFDPEKFSSAINNLNAIYKKYMESGLVGKTIPYEEIKNEIKNDYLYNKGNEGIKEYEIISQKFNSNTIPSSLIAPIQRAPRYNLLITEMIGVHSENKITVEDIQEEKLKNPFKAIQRLAANVNKMQEDVILNATANEITPLIEKFNTNKTDATKKLAAELMNKVEKDIDFIIQNKIPRDTPAEKQKIEKLINAMINLVENDDKKTEYVKNKNIQMLQKQLDEIKNPKVIQQVQPQQPEPVVQVQPIVPPQQPEAQNIQPLEQPNLPPQDLPPVLTVEKIINDLKKQIKEKEEELEGLELGSIFNDNATEQIAQKEQELQQLKESLKIHEDPSPSNVALGNTEQPTPVTQQQSSVNNETLVNAKDKSKKLYIDFTEISADVPTFLADIPATKDISHTFEEYKIQYNENMEYVFKTIENVINFNKQKDPTNILKTLNSNINHADNTLNEFISKLDEASSLLTEQKDIDALQVFKNKALAIQQDFNENIKVLAGQPNLLQKQEPQPQIVGELPPVPIINNLNLMLDDTEDEDIGISFKSEQKNTNKDKNEEDLYPPDGKKTINTLLFTTSSTKPTENLMPLFEIKSDKPIENQTATLTNSTFENFKTIINNKDKQTEYGIDPATVLDKSQVDGSIKFKFKDNNEKVVVKATPDGGINVNVKETISDESIRKLCEMAVFSAQPGFEIHIPENSPHKEKTEKFISEAIESAKAKGVFNDTDKPAPTIAKKSEPKAENSEINAPKKMKNK